MSKDLHGGIFAEAGNDLQQLVKAKLIILNEQKGAGAFYTIRGIAQ
jgi:hypothetical protein